MIEPRPTSGHLSLRHGRGVPVEWRTSALPCAYPDAVAEMENRVDNILAGGRAEMVWLLEHPPLYTAGTSAHAVDLLEPDLLPVFRSGRGGQFTYHGPGQRVVYVLLDLRQRGRDIRCFVSGLEAWIIEALAGFGVAGERRQGRVGVWIRGQNGVAEAKIAAVGVRVRRWVTFHGFSINVRPDLTHYRGIVPCGAAGFGVTSLADQGSDASIPGVDDALRRSFSTVFGGRLKIPSPEYENLADQVG